MSSSTKSPLCGLRQLLKKGSLAIADQGVFAAGNFLLSVLLARRLPAADYGAFSLANSGFLLLAALNQAFIIEPMMVFGAGKFRGSSSAYLRILLLLHAALMVPLGIGMWGAAVFLGRMYSPVTRSAFDSVALFSTFTLLFWIVRRIFYVFLKPGWGLVGSVIYFVSLSVTAGALWIRDNLTPFTAFAAMGASGLVAAAFLLLALQRIQAEPGGSLKLREVAGAHWKYGRWAAGSGIMSWFPSNVYYLILASWLGLQGAAALRALNNFIVPAQQAITAMNLLMIPSLVREYGRSGVAGMLHSMRTFFYLYMAGLGTYLLGLWLARNELFELFYGGRYAEYSGLPLLLAAGLPLGTAAYSVLGNGLRAMELPDRMMWAFLASTAASILFGIPLTARFGVVGALLGNHCSAVLFTLALWRLLASALPSELRQVETAAAPAVRGVILRD